MLFFSQLESIDLNCLSQKSSPQITGGQTLHHSRDLLPRRVQWEKIDSGWDFDLAPPNLHSLNVSRTSIKLCHFLLNAVYNMVSDSMCTYVYIDR